MKKKLRNYISILWILLVLPGLTSGRGIAESVDDTCQVAAPKLSAASDTSCAGRPVLLWATGCDGQVLWSNGLKGDTIVSRPATTRTYKAVCQTGTCVSDSSAPITVTIPIPDIPTIHTLTPAICAGGSATLLASGCPGEVVWSNGSVGKEITVRPTQSTVYTAICRTGTLQCISCFAEPLEIKLVDSVRPLLVSSKSTVCANDSLSLRVIGCPGTIRWSDTSGNTSSVRNERPLTTTTYEAVCQVGTCSYATNLVSVEVAPPTAPTIEATKYVICEGESVAITATGCSGIVEWSNGQTGTNLALVPTQTTTLTASCRVGSCSSGPSEALTLSLSPQAPKPLVTNRTNECPYQTLDLMTTLTTTPRTPGGQFEFRTAPSVEADLVAHPAVSGAGTYYVFERTQASCYSEPAAVTVTINACVAPVPVCSYFPATVAIVQDSTRGSNNIQLRAIVGGMATGGLWSTTGAGTFGSADSLKTTYIPSEADRLNPSVSFTFTTQDPDAEGPCPAAQATLQTRIPAQIIPTVEMLGLSMEVHKQTPLAAQLHEVTYRLQVKNMGTSRLTDVQVRTDLGQAFAGAIMVGKPLVKTVAGFMPNTQFDGQRNTQLLDSTGSDLPVGTTRTIDLTVQINTNGLQNRVFATQALASALDVNGTVCRDLSTNGFLVDPDLDGDPGNNQELTFLTLLSPESEDNELFIPEGFSPNNDGINDLFVIQNVPEQVDVALEVYNRWGQMVYKNDSYKNDWNGKADRGVLAGSQEKGLPDGSYFYLIRLSNGREYIRFMTITR
ncbi:gliding motility-associated C-terminal domain-containing protein [Arundinibacter roseus]|uniref:Gliding motility-associated C-terminal domain-containing protein n=1 Tax=Arundinibacter roseus TaxID=2070510 RepID=A0A4R4JWJ5_9BACT|nr:gliding motility-associated C-terminal domain-containing protein [Arundinibacter roseus]TDB59138.1 gliding motility-associated C-terminal domain-containing protein [Arundinibacter roseus]